MLTRTVGTTVTKYVYGLGLISEETNNTVKVYHFDYRGSTVAITDANGNISDTFAYDTYGKIISRVGSSDIIFCYNGGFGVVTDNNNLIYMRTRYYSPEMRRFVNADIIAGLISETVTLNRYAYANGNPVSNIDPFGLYTQEIFDEDGHATDDNDLGVPGGGGRGGVGHNARVSSGSQKQMTNQSNKVYGNSHSSTNMQHGYEIYEVNSGNVVKTGISGQKLNANGTSPRANTQMKNLNSKGTTQYAARIVVKNVPGRVRILRWEGLNTRRLAEQGNNLYKQERPEWKVYSEIYN